MSLDCTGSAGIGLFTFTVKLRTAPEKLEVMILPLLSVQAVLPLSGAISVAGQTSFVWPF
ncbi:MAG: hypothetical protein NT114_02450 [Patescibacteria group bacterium]|nr:hypothetical protein [Patescibacteria group bacterium]